MTQNLRIPGPTPLPDDVLDAQSRPMIDHRGAEFAEMLHAISSGIARLIGTTGDVLLLTGSGSGAMEAAVVNTLSRGDRVLVVTIGGFGDRFAAIAQAFGADVELLEVPWGEAADPAGLAQRLAGNPPYAAVLVTHNETSTGVTNPIRELAAAIRSAPGDPLVIVDGISGLGAMPFEMDAWGVDLVVSASQKAWMGSPGIGIAALGERAWAAIERADIRGSTGISAQRVPSLTRVRRRGRRRSRCCSVCRSGWSDSSQRGPSTPGPGTRRSRAARRPEWRRPGWAWWHRLDAGPHRDGGLASRGPRVGALQRAMRLGLVIAGGQGKWTGKILRFGHMGHVDWPDIGVALRVLAETLTDSVSPRIPLQPRRPAARRSSPRSSHGEAAPPPRSPRRHGLEPEGRSQELPGSPALDGRPG